MAGAVLLFAVGVAASCGSDGGPTGPAPDAPLDRSLASEHFDYRFAAGDTIRPDEVEINDRAYEVIRDALDADFSRRIEFLKYGGAEHIERLTGRRTDGGFVLAGRIHLTRALDPHEIAHVIVQDELGRPSNFFDEGIAVNFGGLRAEDGVVTLFPSALRSFEVDAEARTVFAAGRFAGSIRPILTSAGFDGVPFEVGYPLAGSFVKFLLESRGIDAVRAFFAASTAFDTIERIEAELAGAFGAPLPLLEAQWRNAAGLPPA